MASVTLRNVHKTYAGGFEAIKGIDFGVGDGQFCVLVGPSGCGKSTLLRMVAGLETITGGEIDIGGRIVNQIEPAERDIAMVFQNYALYPHMSVYNNMAYGLRNRRMAKLRSRPGSRKPPAFSSSAPCSSASRGNCREASVSESQWAAPSCGSPRCFCSTNPCPTSMPSCASRCGSKSANCSGD